MQNMLWIPHTSFRPLFWVCVIVLQKKTSNIICLCMYGWMDGMEWNGMERITNKILVHVTRSEKKTSHVPPGWWTCLPGQHHLRWM